jgi:hypothetical protein
VKNKNESNFKENNKQILLNVDGLEMNGITLRLDLTSGL